MLLKFDDIIKKYGKPKGVIHIGAHLMEERHDYLSFGLNNTIWVEANPDVFSKIEFINRQESNEMVFNYAISDIDNSIVKLNVTNNGQSSSILEMEKHKIHHPTIHVSEILEVTTKRMDVLIKENNIDINEYDFLNIDIQGAELLAIKGFGDLIDNFKFIYVEVNTNYLYKDCALMNEIDEYLVKFKRVETLLTQYEWGDALYVKQDENI
jgi:FkbM family methyltransferase